MKAGVRISPNLLSKPVEEGGEAIHLLFGDFKKEPEAYGTNQNLQRPVKICSKLRWRLGPSQPLSYRPGSVPSRARRGCEGSANRFGTGPANSKRYLKKLSDQGKRKGKLMWFTAHTSSKSLFEMKLCLMGSLPTTAVSWVCVRQVSFMCVLLYVTILTRGFPGEWVC